MFVVRYSLIEPVQLGLGSVHGVDRDDGIGIHGIEGIVLPQVAVEIGVGVGDPSEHFAGLGIERVRGPEPAPEFPAQRGVEAPQLLAGLGIEGHQAAGDAIIADHNADKYLPLPGDGSRTEPLTNFRIRALHVPQHLAGLGVERQHTAICRAAEEPPMQIPGATIARGPRSSA